MLIKNYNVTRGIARQLQAKGSCGMPGAAPAVMEPITVVRSAAAVVMAICAFPKKGDGWGSCPGCPPSVKLLHITAYVQGI